MPHSISASTSIVEGHEVKVAPLETISYERLVARDNTEGERLFEACQSPGFFYLDLQSEAAKKLLPELQMVYTVSSEYFNETSGGKRMSESGGSYEIARDNLIQGNLALPRSLEEHTTLLTRFSEQCHSINQLMLSRLSNALNLSSTDRFETRHRNDKLSESAFNVISAPTKAKRADCPDTTHTDSGTLTTLFGDEWGIMLEDPKAKTWAYIEPKPGCALINVGDSLQKMSGGKLLSCRHAITQPTDGIRRRLYVVSYLRPERG